VCAILWSKEYKELVSSHGFAQNQLIIWKYPALTKVAELSGQFMSHSLIIRMKCCRLGGTDHYLNISDYVIGLFLIISNIFETVRMTLF